MEFEVALAAVRVEIDRRLDGQLVVPPGFLDEHLCEHSQVRSLLDDKTRIRLVRHLETIYGTQQGTGHILRGNFKEWYPARKPDLDFYYWRRLQLYWMRFSNLPVRSIRSQDAVTDEILGLLGDPRDESNWRRRGLVMGHVQSGKTTNYSALITKAADAGYRIIIVLAGLTNSLRFQTQQRLDETFVGRPSVEDSTVNRLYPVATVLRGVEGENQVIRQPYCGTTQLSDFNSGAIGTAGAVEGTFQDPILFVTKKHEKVLERLADWLGGLRHGMPLEGPMLLIDDEADNASINTAKDPEQITRINERIRNLLACCRRTSYVGYTATPFANIFIDPDTDDAMLNEDLFPRHFIKSLDPPDSYIGAKDLFVSSGRLHDACIREIPQDYHDLLPLKHKSGHEVTKLPPSLIGAVREYMLTRAIRWLDDAGHHNSAMLINVSRFNNIQQQIHDEVYQLLVATREAIDAWARSPSWERSELLRDLKATWDEEYANTTRWSWDDVRLVLAKATASIEPRLVNMRGGGIDYTKAPDSGLHIIAIGGLALSRGLTLQGLTVSYVLRNVGAADTLLQMGRWFGYRPGFESLCRIHATGDMIADFEAISDAVEELRDDLVRMEKIGRTPNDFGLKVRQSPTGIAITAKNKMLSASPHPVSIDLSCKHLQGFEAFNDAECFRNNYEAAGEFVDGVESDPACRHADEDGALVWTGVPARRVLELLRGFRSPKLEFVVIDGEHSLVLDYIEDRANDELAIWDVAMPYKNSRFIGGSKLPLPFIEGSDRYCRQRFNGKPGSMGSGIVKFTEKNVVAEPAPWDLIYGEDPERLKEVADRVRDQAPEGEKPSKERAYLMARNRPLLVLHAVEYRLDPGRSGDTLLDLPEGMPAVTLSLAFPATEVAPTPRVYAASVRFRELLKAANEEADGEGDDEVIDADD